MLYHANIAVLNTTMGGGYLGVDVLFVISGYLITGLVLQESSGGGLPTAVFICAVHAGCCQPCCWYPL